MNKEDYSDLCAQLINKTSAISFLSCQIDFNKIISQQTPNGTAEPFEKLRAVQIRGDSELANIASFLDRAISLIRFDYIGVSIFDQLLRYNFNQQM